MTRHLGDRLTALIDGELDHGTRDRMLGHLAQCDECRAEADAERKVKARLGTMAAPQVPVELMLGRWSRMEALSLLGVQWVYLAGLILLTRAAWRNGLRHYAAYGG